MTPTQFFVAYTLGLLTPTIGLLLLGWRAWGFTNWKWHLRWKLTRKHGDRMYVGFAVTAPSEPDTYEELFTSSD